MDAGWNAQGGNLPEDQYPRYDKGLFQDIIYREVEGGTELRSVHQPGGDAKAWVFQQSTNLTVFSTVKSIYSGEVEITSTLKTDDYMVGTEATVNSSWWTMKSTADGSEYTRLKGEVQIAEQYVPNNQTFIQLRVSHDLITDSWTAHMWGQERGLWWRIYPNGEERWGDSRGGDPLLSGDDLTETGLDRDPSIISAGHEIIAAWPLVSDYPSQWKS
ncbi:hypothetical protein M231_01212 [Tremella mesenterica]|uniref:Uncharacterized protein n=1 Tax=Tremella mesenterica TaxID=5217 RepID=A0A4Q1BTU1_TREME|nr:hypothetical protein M231_01212 [Tremella mesenterica]